MKKPMIMITLTALKKPNLLYISSTQFARTFKGNPFLYSQFEYIMTTISLLECLETIPMNFKLSFAKIFIFL